MVGSLERFIFKKAKSKHLNEIFICYKCQELSNNNNPIEFCPKCRIKHEQGNSEHICLSMNKEQVEQLSPLKAQVEEMVSMK